MTVRLPLLSARLPPSLPNTTPLMAPGNIRRPISRVLRPRRAVNMSGMMKMMPMDALKTRNPEIIPARKRTFAKRDGLMKGFGVRRMWKTRTAMAAALPAR